MGLEHPAITRTRRTGYPYSERREMWGIDGLSNDVYTDDEILDFMGEFYLVDNLSLDAIEILEQHGAIYKIVK